MYLCISFLSIVGNESIEIGHFTHSRRLVRGLVARRSVGLVEFVKGVCWLVKSMEHLEVNEGLRITRCQGGRTPA